MSKNLNRPNILTSQETKMIFNRFMKILKKRLFHLLLIIFNIYYTQGTNVVQVSAYDGDYAHPQRLRYGLDPTGLPYSNYFDIDSDLGIVKVRKSLQVLLNRYVKKRERHVSILHNCNLACCCIFGIYTILKDLYLEAGGLFEEE